MSTGLAQRAHKASALCRQRPVRLLLRVLLRLPPPLVVLYPRQSMMESVCVCSGSAACARRDREGYSAVVLLLLMPPNGRCGPCCRSS